MANKPSDDDDDIFKEIDEMDLDGGTKSAAGDDSDSDDIDLDDDDFDLGELDDDLGDDSWDEFDDEEVEKSAKSKGKAKAAEPGERSLPPPKKSGLGKLTTPLIIVAVLGAGGYYYLSTMTQPSNTPRAQPAAEDVALGTPEGGLPMPTADVSQDLGMPSETAEGALPSLTDDADFPPMPAPISSAPEEAPEGFPPMELATEPAEPLPAIEDPGLTPMPSEQSLGDLDVTGLEDLSAVTETAPPPAEDMADMSAPPELPDMTELSDIPLPADVSEPPVLETSEPPPVAEPEQATETLLTPDADITDIAMPEPISAETPEPATLEPEDVTAVPTESPAVDTAALEAAAQLESENESLKGKLEQADDKISSLNQTVEELKSQIKSLQDQAKAPKAATETANVSPPKQPASKPKPVKTSARSSTQASSWVLRSAQPGKAVLSPKGSDDMQTVEVGDTVAGLGKIQTIDIVNGKWMVQGSRGSVSR